MHLLLVNDDGIQSRLLHTLCRAAAARGHRVTVSAPSTQQSAKSHSFTIATPLMAHPAQLEGADAAWAVDGTPVDSCRLGMMALAEEPVDAVLSGINLGYNVGLSTFVSGTVGAAREAAFQGKPAMAVSMEPETPEETLLFFADYCVRLAERLTDYAAPSQCVCNVNVPPVALSELKGAVVCPISRNVYRDDYEGRTSPRGSRYYWLKPMQPDESPTPGSDLDWLGKGFITVTFLTPEGCDQAAYADFPLPL